MEEEENEEKDDEMEIEEEKEDNKKRKSSSKREKDNLKKEEKIREIEKMNENEEIKNREYYEKLLLKDSDNSITWIEYASFILDNLNLASARQIFERALKLINISKTDEKFNIWVAYLNLENLYGNNNSFQKVLDRAKEVCDKKSLYKHLIQIYMSSDKYEDANEAYKLLTKVYFDDYDIWKDYIEFLFQAKEKNASNEILEPKEGLNKSMQVLPKKNHLDIMSLYGQLLYKYKHNEEARNMFDNILKNFPKRKDIWFVYIDKEIKFGQNIEKVRQIFDRIFEIKFKINDLKSIMKKSLEFEKKFSKNEKEFLKAQEKTKEILAKRMQISEEKDKEDKSEDEEE
jgi:rRNA biogenesis protein RRP5